MLPPRVSTAAQAGYDQKSKICKSLPLSNLWLYVLRLFWYALCMKTQQNQTVRKEFFAPLSKALEQSSTTRKCSRYSDQQHLESGVGRVIDKAESGRDWVQTLQMVYNVSVSVSHFFLSLASPRRLSTVSEVADNVRMQLDAYASSSGDDPLAIHSELAKFAVYSTDGHTHGASAHEKPIEKKKRSITHIYSLNLRTHSLAHLALTEPRKGMKKEHELSALKRVGPDALRMGESKGTKVIHVYDPAIIDYKQWYKWKKAKGVYIITKEKSNSALTTIGIFEWDQHDARNNGVVSDEMVGPASGAAMRRVTYIDPVTGVTYRFITNEMTLPPGLIAFLYKLRWDIEKVFDVVKNKTYENKAWAGTEAAKSQQALFIALAHNLMRILEITLKIEEGITDENSAKKRQVRLKGDEKTIKANGRCPNQLVMEWQRITQRCSQFIRWLRCCLQIQSSWAQSVDSLRPLMEKVLS